MTEYSEVHVVAHAARTPVGLTAESSAAAVRAGISRIREHPFLYDNAGDKLKAAYDGVLDPGLLGSARLVALAQAVSTEIASKLGQCGRFEAPVHVLLALPEVRPGFGARELETLRAALLAHWRGQLDLISVELVGDGHAGGLRALELAIARLAGGATEEICVAGGVDSYLDEDTLDWLDADRRLAGAEVRSGTFVGEGASMLALTTERGRSRLKAPSMARLRAVACARELRDASSDEGLLGEALTEVIRRVTAGLGSVLIADVYTDLNGERQRTEDWGFALMRTAASFRDGSAYSTAVGQTGDLGAATASLGCVRAIEAWRRGYATGDNALIVGASWGSLRGAALLAPSDPSKG